MRTGLLRNMYRFFRAWRWWSIRLKAWRQGSTIRVGVGSYILSSSVSISVAPGATLRIGNDVCLRRGTSIQVHECVEIGDDVLIAESVTIRDHDHVISTNPSIPHRKAGFVSAPIHIEDNVWLGNKVTVTRGVRIGAHSVIGANSVVTRDIPSGIVAAGIPTRVLRSTV